MLDQLNAPPKAPACACCPRASETEIWGNRVCYRCHSAWVSDERFSSGAINKHLQLSDRPEDFTPANHARYCAEATKRTAAWVAERKTTARAA